MTVDSGINGFEFAAARAGLRGKDELDVGLIVCRRPAAAAAVFTTNLVQAAPVILGRERIRSGRLRAVLVNSAIANACTGDEGLANARRCAALTAQALEVDEEMVLVSSTGVIGEQLEMARFEAVIPELAARLSPSALPEVAQAVMTTDTVPKIASRQSRLSLNGPEVKIGGIAKGAGMIMPNMATMLSFIMTDANISPALLRDMLPGAVEQSFNRITVDGDTSTNDTVIIMASGRSGGREINDLNSPEAAAFAGMLHEVTRDLALQIVADGEGATKLVTIRVRGALNDAEAELAARTVADSALVKTAFFGSDPNWGRIMAALGRSGAAFDPARVVISVGDNELVKDGHLLSAAAERSAARIMAQKEFPLTIDLKAGESQAEIYTCDLSLDYVRINADYRT